MSPPGLIRNVPLSSRPWRSRREENDDESPGVDAGRGAGAGEGGDFAYGTFVANGPSAFVLGVAGATTPSIYNLQSLTLNSSAALEVVGPVIVTVANSVTIHGTAGASSPGLLRLKVASSGVTVNSNAVLNGSVIGTLNGGAIADRLIVNGNGTLRAQD